MSEPDDAASRPPDPVDWPTARQVARLVARRDAARGLVPRHVARRDFEALTTEAEDLVADFTGLRRRATRTRRCSTGRVGRRQHRLDAPDARAAHRHASANGSRTARSRRSAGTSPRPRSARCSATSRSGCSASTTCSCPTTRDGDAVYYVGPNILALEKRFAFRPLDFRRWIAIHEVTHRAQFTGVPWMRDYFLSLVQDRSIVDPDPRTVFKAISRALDALRRGRNPLDDGGLVGLFASPEQQASSAGCRR